MSASSKTAGKHDTAPDTGRAARTPAGRFAIRDPEMEPGAAVWHILRSYLSTASSNLDGAIEGNERALHDLRVGLRRLCEALRTFRPVLQNTRLPSLSKKLRDCTRLLGPARDRDVWCRRLDKWCRRGPTSPKIQAYRDHMHRLRKLERRRLRTRLRSGRFPRVLTAVGYEIDNAEKTATNSDTTLKSFASRKVGRVFRDLVSHPPPERTPDALHRLRSRVRRARYAAEMFAPVLGKPVQRLAALYKDIADDLGTVHDMDVVPTMSIPGAPQPSPWVMANVRRLRRKSLHAFAKHWKTLRMPQTMADVRGALEHVRKGPVARLYIVRHGIAVDIGKHGVKHDHERMLSARGRKRTQKIGRALALLDWAPDRVLTSPLVRALETARIMAKLSGNNPRLSTSKRLAPDTPIERMAATVVGAVDSAVVVVGHMPSLGKLAGYLLTGDESIELPLKKAGVCCLAFEGSVAPGAGRLEWLMQPRHLAALARKLGRITL